MAFTIALVIFFLALLAAFIFRKRRWSRALAILLAAVCVHMTLYLIPPPPAILPGETHVDWDNLIADIFGRIIFVALLISSVQLRFIWQKPLTAGPKPRGPDDGFQLY